MAASRLVYLLCAFCAFGAPVGAQPLEEAYDVRILPGWRMADGQHRAAVQVTLADGWKTYWRAPGDAGIPPRFDWSGSRNLSDVEITWPTPKALDQNGMQTIGYADQVTFPLRIQPRRTGQAVQLSGQLEIGVCKDVCIPVTVDLSQLLPASDTRADPAIVAAMADRPYSAREASVGRVACSLTPNGTGLKVRAEIDLPRTGGREVAVIETNNPKIWVGQAVTTRQGQRLTAEAEMYHVDDRAFAVDRSGLRITVLGNSHAVDIQGCPAG